MRCRSATWRLARGARPLHWCRNMKAIDLARLILSLPEDQQQLPIGYGPSREYEGRVAVTQLLLQAAECRLPDYPRSEENDDSALFPRFIELR